LRPAPRVVSNPLFMSQAKRVLPVLLLLSLSLARAAEYELGCPGDAKQQPGRWQIDECTVQVAATGDGACRATVSKAGAAIFDETGPSFVMEAVSGKDMDSDEVREVIFRTQGKERRFAYRIVGCEPGRPVLSFENWYAARFEPTSRGRRVVVFRDDGFRGMPDLQSSDLAGESAPEVWLMLEKGKLVDESHQFRAHFDLTIRELHASLSPPTLRKFHAGKMENEDDRKTVAARIVRLVASYLESGREENGLKELKRMWPPADYERVKQAILAAIQNGTAKRIAVPATP
jgi:hypothetical protein